MLRRPCARHNASAALIKGVPANAVEFGYRVRVSALQFTLGLHLASLVGYYGAARSASALYFSINVLKRPAAPRLRAVIKAAAANQQRRVFVDIVDA